MDTISGFIERITFRSEESGFTVAKLKETGKSDLTVLVGVMPGVHVGESVKCDGEWKKHPVHGPQFDVQGIAVETPSDAAGIEKYLASGLVKGVGPVYAEKIVRLFGDKTLEVIDQTPDRLKHVPGLGKTRIRQIKESWAEHMAVRQLIMFLQAHGVTTTFAQKIYKFYGDVALKTVKENPYQLARDIWGVGFRTADTLAQKLGMSVTAPERIRAGIEYVLSELTSEGHTCYPLGDFKKVAADLLFENEPFTPDCIVVAISELEHEGRVEVANLEDDMGVSLKAIWLKSMAIAEASIAKELRRLTNPDHALSNRDKAVHAQATLQELAQDLGIEFAPQQAMAITTAINEKVTIITGGPGTGKSTITKAILTSALQQKRVVLLAAPTGRAAKRMTEITGHTASTIHSMLKFDFRAGGFKHGSKDPLEADLFIVDEASMIDTSLMAALLRAIPTSAKLIIVGDVNQLPSVGAGNVLKDIIASKAVATVMLTEIFRQAKGSRIITNAHAVNEGLMPDLKNDKDGDFFFLEADTPEEVASTIVDLVARRLPKTYGVHPIWDIQVLTPQNRGIVGTLALNQQLQSQLINMKADHLLRDGKEFYVGDKVMQLRNNYQREVYNGDMGQIKAIY
ncbi:MAG: ATP-dependent RecD-like DNA helicase, partial [bacterium]|nr:ATP-dependent RecD-like DNA helicase [bacterium]